MFSWRLKSNCYLGNPAPSLLINITSKYTKLRRRMEKHPQITIFFWFEDSSKYTGCPRRNVPDPGRVFLMLKYTDITQNTYVQSWTVTEIMPREKCGLLVGPHTVPASWQSYPFPSLSMVSYDGNSAHAKPLNCICTRTCFRVICSAVYHSVVNGW